MFLKFYCRLVTAIILLCVGLQSEAMSIYFDNSQKQWETPHIYYWSVESPKYPGVEMNKTDHPDIWKYEVPDGTTGLLFNAGDGDKTKTGDFNAANGHVYNDKGDSGKDLETYLSGTSTDPGTGSDGKTVFVYADVPDTWTNMYAYVYIDNNGANANWPGVAMTSDPETGYWKYEVPAKFASQGRVIFSSKDNKNNRHPANDQPGLEIKGKNMIYRYQNGNNKWEEYTSDTPGPIDPVEPGKDITYKIHFHNNVDWNQVYVTISGILPEINGQMSSFLNSGIFDYEFVAPENATLYCKFHDNANSSSRNFRVVNGHVYTVSSDKGPLDEYDKDDTVKEAEYWIEPEYPTALQEATLYFNRAYSENSNLKDENDIYIHTGLIAEGEPNTGWTAASNWDSPSDKFKMTPISEGSDIFKITFSPSIAEYYDVDSETSYDRLALIFRNKSENKQHNDDQFIKLRPIPAAGEGLGAVNNYEFQNDGSVKITSERGELYLTPWSKDVIKVFTLRNSATKREERKSISVIDNETKTKYGIETPEFYVDDADGMLTFYITDGVSVEVDKATSLLSFFNDGQQSSQPTLSELGGLSNKTGNVTVTFNGMGDAGFYGGGYNGNLVNWEGNGMKMDNNQDGNWGQGGRLDRNICIPFFVSTSGYGVYFDDHYRYAMIYPSKNGSSYSSGSKDPIAYYFIGGGSMESVMQNYTCLTGLQELPPFWALGYITSKFSFATRDEAEQAISKTKAIDIPVDGIIFDIHWQTDDRLRVSGTEGMGRINWSDCYPNPQDMMKKFREQNVHTIAITEPYFTSNSGNYDFLKNKRYLADEHVENMGWLNSQHVGLLDITNQGAVDWYKDLYKARTREGIESWWLDLGEPEKHDGDSHYSDGSSVDQMNNEYGNRWTELAFQALKEETPDTRFITMPRAGTSGMQRFNAFPWTGDIARSWSGLAAQVPALVSAAMSGVSYLGSDIGGFSANGTDANLYRRWVQLGVFYPSMRTHSATEPEVWRDAYSGIRNDVRDAINLRYAYLPYTYSQSYAYTRYGTPIARPANFNDADKSVLSNEIGTYFWGPDLFVAPVLEYNNSKNIAFPDGDWLDMTDFSTKYQGHSRISYNAPVNKLPRFMRRGSFITRYRQDTFTSTAEIASDRLTVDHFCPDGTEAAAGSSFYDDDHKDVNAIRDKKYVLTHFNSHVADKAMMIAIDTEGAGWEGMNDTRDYLLRIHDFNIDDNGNPLPSSMVRLYTFNSSRPRAESPEKAVAVSTPFTSLNSEDAVRNASGPAYYHDRQGGHIYLRLPQASTLGRYTIELGQTGILTGIDTPANLGAMTLGFADGLISYSAPEGTEDLNIEIYSASGASFATYAGLNADGYVSQIPVDLPAGIYIARIQGRNSAGESAFKTAKIIIR